MNSLPSIGREAILFAFAQSTISTSLSEMVLSFPKALVELMNGMGGSSYEREQNEVKRRYKVSADFDKVLLSSSKQIGIIRSSFYVCDLLDLAK